MQGRVTSPLFGTVSFGEQMTETNEIIVAAPHLIWRERNALSFFKYNTSLFLPCWSHKFGCLVAPTDGRGADLDALQRR